MVTIVEKRIDTTVSDRHCAMVVGEFHSDAYILKGSRTRSRLKKGTSQQKYILQMDLAPVSSSRRASVDAGKARGEQQQ